MVTYAKRTDHTDRTEEAIRFAQKERHDVRIRYCQQLSYCGGDFHISGDRVPKPIWFIYEVCIYTAVCFYCRLYKYQVFAKMQGCRAYSIAPVLYCTSDFFCF